MRLPCCWPLLTMGVLLKPRGCVCALFGLLAATSLYFSINPHQTTNSIQGFYQETQVQLQNLQRNFDPDDSRHQLLTVEDKYLEQLGLTDHDANERLWPNSSWHKHKNASVPVIVSSIQNGRVGEAVHFIRSAKHFLPNYTLIMYDLGLSSHELELLGRYCNSSSCQVTRFDSSEADLPSHVSHYSNGAFRPILIQMTLKEAGCVLWLELDQRLTSSHISRSLNRADQSGVQAWPTDEKMPTSAKTHPKMLTRLGVEEYKEEYNFQHMGLLVFNRLKIHEHLIKPWVKCALIPDCLEPIGAQATGCRYDKKPQFRYSGCHNYEVSALNLLLGQLFSFDENEYLDGGSARFFTPMDKEVEAEDNVDEGEFGVHNNTNMPPARDFESSESNSIIVSTEDFKSYTDSQNVVNRHKDHGLK